MIDLGSYDCQGPYLGTRENHDISDAIYGLRTVGSVSWGHRSGQDPVSEMWNRSQDKSVRGGVRKNIALCNHLDLSGFRKVG